MLEKVFKRIFIVLIFLILLVPWFVARDLLFPFITAKAFAFRVLIELALPFYTYLVFLKPKFRPKKTNILNWLVIGFLVSSLISSVLGVNIERSLWGNFERMGGTYYLFHLSLLYFYLVLLGRMSPVVLKRFFDFLILDGVLLTIFGYFAKIAYFNDPKHLPHTLSLDPLRWFDTHSWATAFSTFEGINKFLFSTIFDKILDPSLPGRVSTTFGNPIFLGSFLIVPLFFAGYLFFVSEGYGKKAWYLFSILVLLLGIVQTGTRGAVVGLALGILTAGVLYILLSNTKKVRLYGGLSILFLALLILVGVIFKSHLPQGSVLKRVLSLRDSNSTSRILQWKVALSGYKDYPVWGTGPENYYIIANKNYNPEIYKYDVSWFDKPHNYWLEILTTGGAVGFMFYLGIFLYSLYGLYLAYAKKQLLSLVEVAVLIGGGVAYQIQNLFVFDTVSTSLVFFIFLGFCGFLLDEKYGHELVKSKNIKSGSENSLFSSAVFSVSLIVCVYLIYTTNILPASTCKAVNYGYAYAGIDPLKANDYFDNALNSYFNFDTTETLSRYGEFVLNFAQARQDGLPVLKKATSLVYEKAQEVGNSPVLWQQTSNLFLYQSYLTATALDPRAKLAINNAKDLAPERVEYKSLMVQIANFEGNKNLAEKLAEEIVAVNPSLDYQWQLAVVYHQNAKEENAIKIYQNLRNKDYSFRSVSNLSWIIAYYEKQKDFVNSTLWYETAAKLNPNDPVFYVAMAKNYWSAGQTEKAKDMARKIVEIDKTKTESLKEILESK
jgi:hypothetical protein